MKMMAGFKKMAGTTVKRSRSRSRRRRRSAHA
jgi:hypothetical protein